MQRAPTLPQMNSTSAAAATGLGSVIFEYCVRWGAFGRLLTYYITFAPVFLWAGFWGMASFSQEVYYLLLSQEFWVSWAATYVLREFTSWSAARPHPECTSSDFGGPSYIMATLVHYAVAIWLHQLYWRVPVLRFYNLLLLLQIVLSFFWLVFTGNAGLLQVLQGIIVGIVCAAVLGYLLLFAVLPTLPEVTSWFAWPFDWHHHEDLRMHPKGVPPF